MSYVEAFSGNEESEDLRLTVSQVLGSGNAFCVLIKPHDAYGEGFSFTISFSNIFCCVDMNNV